MTASEKFVVDSNGWVEALGTGPQAAQFEAIIAANCPVVMPTMVIYEVYKKLLLTTDEHIVLRFVSHALRQTIVPLDEHLAFAAASVSVQRKLPMADAIIYATAQAHKAQLVTSDAHFQGLPNVTMI